MTEGGRRRALSADYSSVAPTKRIRHDEQDHLVQRKAAHRDDIGSSDEHTLKNGDRVSAGINNLRTHIAALNAYIPVRRLFHRPRFTLLSFPDVLLFSALL